MEREWLNMIWGNPSLAFYRRQRLPLVRRLSYVPRGWYHWHIGGPEPASRWFSASAATEDGRMTARRVLHKQLYRKNGFGGVTNTTLCGRVRGDQTDMNVADADDEVTCKFCLRRLGKRFLAPFRADTRAAL